MPYHPVRCDSWLRPVAPTDREQRLAGHPRSTRTDDDAVIGRAICSSILTAVLANSRSSGARPTSSATKLPAADSRGSLSRKWRYANGILQVSKPKADFAGPFGRESAKTNHRRTAAVSIMNPVKALESHGQSVWLDFLARGFIAKGDRRLRRVRCFYRQGAQARRQVGRGAVRDGRGRRYPARRRRAASLRAQAGNEIMTIAFDVPWHPCPNRSIRLTSRSSRNPSCGRPTPENEMRP